ncbi:ceramide kinase-like [Pecten maximus]|uniref:ceramide kinase-like n=1 Tax=Pecten maximus TaxID=6579 RepID=UPI001458798C|nr:ceramide kinase-like [Pecten maximus]
MTSYRLTAGADQAEIEVTVDEKCMTFPSKNENLCVEFEDLVAILDQDTGNSQQSVTIHYIKHSGFLLSKEIVQLSGDPTVLKQFQEHVQAKFIKVPASQSRHFLVFINPIGGKGTGEKTYNDTIKPLFDLAGITCEVVVSERPDMCTEVMESQDLTNIDGIIVCGGDGTLSEVTNVLLRRTMVAADLDFNDSKVKVPPTAIPVGHIPTGIIITSM